MDEEIWLNICALEHAVIYGQLKGNYIELIAFIWASKGEWVVSTSYSKEVLSLWTMNGIVGDCVVMCWQGFNNGVLLLLLVNL